MSEKQQQAEAIPNGPQEDEIDLADLVGVLYRNRYLIIAVTLLVGLAGVGFSFLQTPKYEASTFLEIGQTASDGSFQNIQSPETVKNRLQSAAQSLARDFPGKGPEKQLLFSPEGSLQIEAPENGNLLRISLEAPEDSAALPFLKKLNRSLVTAHGRLFAQKTDELQNQIKQVRVDIQRIDNRIEDTKRSYETKKIRQRNEVTRIEGQIDNLKTRRATLQEQLALLKKEKADLAKRVEETETRYEQLSRSKTAANEDASNRSAIGLMLFSNEILRIQRHLEDLRTRLLFKIPEQKAEYQADVKELGNKIQNQKAKLTEACTQLEQLDAELQSEIEKLQSNKEERKLRIEALQNQSKHMILTKITAAPRFSENKVAPNTKLNVALSLVLGGFLSIFLAFLAEFWRNNRKRIVRGDETDS